MKKNHLFLLVSLTILLLTPFGGFANEPGDGASTPFESNENTTALQQDAPIASNTDPDPGPNDPNDTTPIDGGLSLLLVAGAAYGVKKYREKSVELSVECFS